MQFSASKAVMLCIAAKAFASPPPHKATVSVKDDGFPEVIDLKEIIELEIADADRFANLRESEWQQRLRDIQDVRARVQDAVGNLNAKKQSGSENHDVLLEIQGAKDKLRSEELSIFSMVKNGNVLSDDVIQNLDSNLDEARRQIQEARAKLHAEPLPTFADHEEEMAKEAMESVDELIKIPNELLPSQQEKDKEEAIATVNQLLNQPSKEELEAEQLMKEEQDLMRDLKEMQEAIAAVDNFTQHFETQLQERLGNIQSARSQIRESMQLVDKLQNPSSDTKQQAMNVLEDVKQAKAKLHAEHQGMFSVVKRQPVLSDRIINNLDDHLDEARQLIKEARARLAAEPPLFPGEHFKEEMKEAPADHEQALKDIRRDVRTVRAAIAQQNEPSVVRTQLV